MLTLYGIPNCDSCRKARKWLDSKNVAYHFHDLRADGIDRHRIREWLRAVDWKTLLNTRSTTWRELTAAEKKDLDEARAIKLLLAHPTLIKRPVLQSGETLAVGFSAEKYAALRLA